MTRLSRCALVAVIVFASLAMIAQAFQDARPVAPVPGPGADLPKTLRSPGDLAQARAEVAQRVIDGLTQQMEAPPAADEKIGGMVQLLEQLLLWQGRRLDARLDAAKTATARVAVLQEEWKAASEMERLVKQHAQASVTFTMLDVARFEFARLEIEYRLAMEKTTANR